MTLRDEYLLIKGDRPMATAEEIVGWAEKHKRSDWHGKLEWDDAKAGHSWRVQQVRMLLAIHIVDPGTKVREVVSLSIDRTNKQGGGYRLLNDVLADEELRDVLLRDALAELNRIRTKYGRLAELAKVWAAIDQAEVAERRKVARRRKGGEEQATA